MRDTRCSAFSFLAVAALLVFAPGVNTCGYSTAEECAIACVGEAGTAFCCCSSYDTCCGYNPISLVDTCQSVGGTAWTCATPSPSPTTPAPVAPTPSPGGTPTQPSGGESGGSSGSCFESNSLVLTPSGPRRFADLRYGDEVVNRHGSVEKVIAVAHAGHRQTYAAVKMLKLTTSTNHTLTYTPAHAIQDGRGRLLSVHNPDWDGRLTLSSGEVVNVTSFSDVIVADYRNVYTDGSNELVVNGFAVSTLFDGEPLKNFVVMGLASLNRVTYDWFGVDLFKLGEESFPSAYMAMAIVLSASPQLTSDGRTSVSP